MLKIKNNTDQVVQLHTHEFQPNEELEIDNSWYHIDELLTYITNGDFSVIVDGSTIVSISNQLDYLKGKFVSIDQETPVRSYALAEGQNLRARLIGMFNETITKESTVELDWKILSVSYLGVTKDSFMDGIEYVAFNSKVGDTMTFQVVDKDGVFYPAGTVLDEFGKNWGVFPNQNTIKLYKAKLIPNMYIRIIYTSTSTTTDVDFVCNLFRHMDVK